MLGSSPLARGLRRTRLSRTARSRIIPARAGFTRGPGRWRRRAQDHPRSRGVYKGLNVVAFMAPGSSPLARGLLAQREAPRLALRIIPARAGFTACPGRGRWRHRDNPRARGVYPSLKAEIAARAGSSPLARGLHAGLRVRARVGGIIPARAGFTDTASWAIPSRTDHPRSRGVYTPSATRSS